MSGLSEYKLIEPQNVKTFIMEVFNVLGYVPFEETMFTNVIEYIKFLKKVFIKNMHPDVSDQMSANTFGNYIEIFDILLKHSEEIEDAYVAGKLRGSDEHKTYTITMKDIDNDFVVLEDEKLPLPTKEKVVFKGFGEPGLPPGDIIYTFSNLVVRNGRAIYVFETYDATKREIDGYRIYETPTIYLATRKGTLLDYKGKTLMVEKVKIDKKAGRKL